MNDHEPLDFVDQALATLRDCPIPNGPTKELADTTANRLNKMTIPPTGSLILRRNWMSGIARYSSVSALSASIAAAAAVWLATINHSSRLAFADVQNQVQKVRTVRYIETRLVEEPSDDFEESEAAIKAGTKTSGRVSSSAHQLRIIRVRGRSQQRTETLNAMGEISQIHIVDLKEGKSVSLSPKEKRFVDLNTQVSIDVDSGQNTETKVQPSPEVDLFARISEIPSDGTTLLPARTING